MQDRSPEAAVRAPARDTYRHGDLRRALLDAGIELARSGGPQAVVLREATRRAGVAPNAAYRHFASRQDLLEAVRMAALSAMAQAMEKEVAAVRRARNSAAYARDCLSAVGVAYLRFAQEETGLFRAGFAPAEPVELVRPNPDKAGPGGLNPFELLGTVLDRMVEAGVLAASRRPGAEYLAWSAVHGLALLVIDGPLARMPQKELQAMGKRLLDMVEKGL
ncbi:TetR/AcrR family transcriptional regulator [Variovorax sp. OV329]|uniref:TetR/AcrR family transcriptional regulator n=1 Tax=Variovorax sp. OV329 TaxID=1882825 RepID=UPI0008ED7284|nr:TetR/AcrR family transcriptional regulator [Variovorax sp. OV329]SFM14769.1 transcriptional regulator, TetR family [Variovorax sp. OV329]